MTTFVPLRQRGSSFLHRHHSGNMLKASHRSESPKPALFEGTDAVPQNRKVAVQRVVEIHDALELRDQAEASTEAQRNDSARTSSDNISMDFDAVDLPHSEVRAFKYFLRKWDHNQRPDSEFDQAVQASEADFEEAAIKHFFRRIALWDESEEVLRATRKEMENRSRSNKKRSRDSVLGKLWMKERSNQEHNSYDELKETTTREGLAQLLWTLMHDQTTPLAPQFVSECTDAVKRKYGIKS
ncbi:hypothetical protein HBH69_008580 [Parastagonospora nodorum]|nr:hypothetical protein HBH69_008580 [Parastagonospora nodorum]KAH5658057.1 hypothetical protein HBI23_138860 [Parastagonospora nodorum]